jgi:hypothetical protein
MSWSPWSRDDLSPKPWLQSTGRCRHSAEAAPGPWSATPWAPAAKLEVNKQHKTLVFKWCFICLRHCCFILTSATSYL